MKFLYLLACVAIIPSFCAAQQHSKNIFVELGGPGFFSVNLDKRFNKTDRGFGGRAGLGIITDLHATGITLPIGINYLAGGKGHFLEIGAGFSFVHMPLVNQDQPFNFPKQSFIAGHGWLGYRYQPQQKNFTFRAGFCQYIGHLNLPTILGVPALYPAVSFGYSLY